jgi:hypothetical protein
MNLERPVSGREYTREWTIYKWERALEDFIKFVDRRGIE